MIYGCTQKRETPCFTACAPGRACFGQMPRLRFGSASARAFEERRERIGWIGGAILAVIGEMARAAGPGDESRRAGVSPLQEEVEAAIEASLPQGRPRMERIAGALGVARHTLYRRLRGEGLTFEALVDRVRQRLARRLIEQEGASVKEAAYRLGFAEPAAFSRAFKRWTGKSPGEARRPRRPSRDS